MTSKRAKHQIEGTRVDQPRIPFRRDKQILELMRDLRDVNEPEHLRRAFQAMRFAKDVRDDLRGLAAVLRAAA